MLRVNSNINSDFKKKYSYEERVDESTRALIKHPCRRPVICEKIKYQNDLPNIDNIKYLVPYDITIGQFIFFIRNRIQIKPQEAIFLFINNKIISGSTMMGRIYESAKDNDGFLYVQYAKENTFG